MAQPIPQVGIKGKIQAVREVVPGRSNNVIYMVLQYYDDNVENTIQAFLEDGAKEALNEWHIPGGNKPSTKKKKNRNRNRNKVNGESQQGITQNGSARRSPDDLLPAAEDNAPADEEAFNGVVSGASSQESVPSNSLLNGFDPLLQKTDLDGVLSNSETCEDTHPAQVNHTHKATSLGNQSHADSLPANSIAKSSADSLRSTSSSKNLLSKSTSLVSSSTTTSTAKSTHPSSQKPQRPKTLEGAKSGRERTASAVSEASVDSSHPELKSTATHLNLDKACKDLKRQTLSLQRIKTVLGDECDTSFKKIAKVFEELRNQVDEREAEIFLDMDKFKKQANDAINQRQRQASMLKDRTNRVSSMKVRELAELKADIKLFVSERKIDDDLGSTQRFVCDLDHILKELNTFCHVVPAKTTYCTRRPSISSVTSSISDLTSPVTPLTPLTPSVSLTQGNTQEHLERGGHRNVKSSTRVVKQSESLTKYEVSEQHTKLANAQSDKTSQSQNASFSKSQAPFRNPQGSYHQGDARKNRNARRAQMKREKQRMSQKATTEDTAEKASETKTTEANRSQENPPQTQKHEQKKGQDQMRAAQQNHIQSNDKPEKEKLQPLKMPQTSGSDRARPAGSDKEEHKTSLERTRQPYGAGDASDRRKSGNRGRYRGPPPRNQNGPLSGRNQNPGSQNNPKSVTVSVADLGSTNSKQRFDQPSTDQVSNSKRPLKDSESKLDSDKNNGLNISADVYTGGGDALPQRKPRNRPDRQPKEEHSLVVNGNINGLEMNGNHN